MNTLCWLSAGDLIKQLPSGAVTSSQMVNATLERMAECEPALNAIYINKAEAARVQASASDQRRRAGKPLSPLDGVPITLKENLYSVGDPAPIGTRASPLEAKTVNAPITDRLHESGLVVVGKTTMPDFGMLSSGQSSFHGVTRNPWQRDRNPGGSSSGEGLPVRPVTGRCTLAPTLVARYAYRQASAGFTGSNPRSVGCRSTHRTWAAWRGP